MSAEILTGKTLAAEIRASVSHEAAQLIDHGVTPCLAVVIATEDETANFYVKHIISAAEKTSVLAHIEQLSPTATKEELTAKIMNLAADNNVHGIILQTPLPTGVIADDLRTLIPPEKDVDGANPLSAGRLLCGIKAFAPSTAAAVMNILQRHEIALKGARVVIIGRSLVVGKPLAHLMLAADATVTICHSKTRDLAIVAQEADILVVAIGRPNYITAEYVKQGAIVIDVGTNVQPDGSLVGDIDSNSIQTIAKAYTPVPGGVGPVTTALLLKQTIEATKQT
ncbi:MAG: bifunctional 5,10-methylenetetrahydrofolate dehydrogenase/5,10-methenyltetrahydrofolate cyclohydrolase [Patescibacteria group bacterium]